VRQGRVVRECERCRRDIVAAADGLDDVRSPPGWVDEDERTAIGPGQVEQIRERVVANLGRRPGAGQRRREILQGVGERRLAFGTPPRRTFGLEVALQTLQNEDGCEGGAEKQDEGHTGALQRGECSARRQQRVQAV
jgi:hypothetical protein